MINNYFLRFHHRLSNWYHKLLHLLHLRLHHLLLLLHHLHQCVLILGCLPLLLLPLHLPHLQNLKAKVAWLKK
jgi:hypothetical protein